MSQGDRIILRSVDSSSERSVVLLCNSTRVLLPYKEITNICRPRTVIFIKTSHNVPLCYTLMITCSF